MRNTRTEAAAVILHIHALLFTALAAGCAGDNAARENLTSGFASLQSQQYEDAIGRADAQLAKTPHGNGTPEALYLRGRAIEQRAKSNPHAVAADLASARQTYVDALNLKPSAPLDAYIRTSLANVAYWQDDYATAMQQWSAAYGKLGERSGECDPFILYRIGLCQQRLGQFDAADRTFATVIQRYPTTEAADRARQHSGFRSFAVQLATFASVQSADRATTELRKEGLTPTRLVDPRGGHVLRVGPANTYAAAQQLRQRFASKYPEAIIVP
jgi:tetratricopeptide (TPR) repeat protein